MTFGIQNKTGLSGGDGIIKVDTSQIPENSEMSLTVKKAGYESVIDKTLYFSMDEDLFQQVYMKRQGKLNSPTNCEDGVPDAELKVIPEKVREGASFDVEYEGVCPEKSFIGIYSPSKNDSLGRGSIYQQPVTLYNGSLHFEGLNSGRWEARSYQKYPRGATVTGRVQFDVFSSEK